MRSIRIIGICLLLSLTLMTHGQQRATEAQTRAMIEKINRTAAGIRTMECDFTQVKTLQFLDDKITSEGRMTFGGNGKLRWEYTSPYRYTFILNGDKAYMGSGKDRQTVDMSQSRLMQGIARMMTNSVTGSGLDSSGDFDCTMYVDGEEWIADMMPRSKDVKRIFKKVRLHFNSRQQTVTMVEMTEPTGDTTEIKLRNVKTNGRIDDKAFAAQ